jgi:glycerophosphoryl diester phosphodiesterase
MNKKTIFIILTLLSFILGSGAIGYLYYYTNPIKNNRPDLSDSKYFIAHATGSIYGYVYVNSKESLIKSIENGYQLIEVDLDKTSDGILVCVHDWEDFNKASIPNICWRDSCQFLKIPTLKEFKQRKIYGLFTPLTLREVIELQKEYHFTLVTDRISNPTILNDYFNQGNRKDVMVEAFSEEDYHRLKADGYIPMLSVQLITDYSDCLKFIVTHLINNDVEWIVVDYHSRLRFLRLLKKLFGIKIAAYTINSPSYLFEHLENDFDLVYTDNWNIRTQINNYQNHTTR